MALGNKTLEDLLNPIASKLGHEKVADALEMPEWEFTAARVTDGLNHEQLVDLFVSEAEKIRVQVTRCGKDGIADAIAEIVGKGTPDSGDACSVVLADDDLFAEVGLAEKVAALPLVSKATVWDESNGAADIEDARVATYGITHAVAGIAETATIVQPTNPKCGRSISLLPLVHIAVVKASTIEPTMLEVMKNINGKPGVLPSQICFISGPSATADIELVRVEGVHGPMYVHYVLVD